MNDENLFWWAGVTHTDGYIYRKNGSLREIRLRVSEPSFPMLVRWKNTLDLLTGKQHRILVEQMYDSRYDRHFEQYLARDGSKQTIMKLVELFKEKEINLLDYAAPEPAFGSPEKTGAYLAGVIDGDGCIQVKPRSDGSGIERLIKIVNGDRKPLESIQRLLLALNLPDGYIVDYANHFDLWIYLNKSLISWSEEFIAPQLSLKRKAAKL